MLPSCYILGGSIQKEVRLVCSPDITKKGGPLVVAIFLRELNQASPVENAFKVSFALYFTFYEAQYILEKEIFGICLNIDEQICVFAFILGGFIFNINDVLSPGSKSQSEIQILQDIQSVCKLHCWTHHFKNSHMKKNV